MQLPRPWCCPTANDLVVDPELSILALLDAALAVTLEALSALLPELDPQACTWTEASTVLLATRKIVVHGRYLCDLIDDCRHALGRCFVDDMPF